MADNFTLPDNTGTRKAATDQVTYSDETADVQLVRVVGVTGVEGSKAVVNLPVDGTNGLSVDVTRLPGGAGGVAHDAPAAAVNPVLAGGFASSSAPADVSADGDAVRAWNLRNGARVVNLVATNGTFISTADGVYCQGGVAHDSPDAGSPVKVGAKALAALSTITPVADGDRVNLAADLDGAAIVRQDAPLGDMLYERLTDTAGTAANSAVFGATASARNVICYVALYNDSTTNGFIDFLDGTTPGTVLLTLPLPAKGGVVFQPPRPLRQPTANNAFRYDVSAALTTVYISLGGYKSKL